jgi:hypothetical protein
MTFVNNFLMRVFRNIAKYIVLISFAGCAHRSVLPERRTANSSDLNFIFTSHSMMPKAEGELDSVLNSIGPDILLVEIDEEDVLGKRFDGYPTEMIFAYHWACQRGTIVHGFNCSLETKPEGVTEEIRKEVNRKFQEFNQNKSWRDKNRPDIAHAANLIMIPLTDPVKMARREQCMLDNIRSYSTGGPEKVLVLTGSGHSDFFRVEAMDARFPLTPKQ